jgi:hypothetical protein
MKHKEILHADEQHIEWNATLDKLDVAKLLQCKASAKNGRPRRVPKLEVQLGRIV